MSEFTTWEEMSTLEQMASQYWDMYKDAHGIRPRGIDTSSWTEADFNKEFEELNLISELNCRQRREDEQIASRKFESRVKELMEIGAKDREMAMRWIHEAEGSNGDDEFLCYLVGLPYRYFAKMAA
jgi:hypothetical protein